MPARTLERTLMAVYEKTAARTAAVPPSRRSCPQFEARVLAVTDLSPAFRRVTLATPDVRELRLMGPDEYLGLFMPPPGRAVALPDADAVNPRSALASVPEAERPELRWYTVRAHRPEDGELDVDVVSTGHDGPGARWIAAVRPGDRVGVRAMTAPYASAPPAGHHLLLADETGLPGMLAVLDSAPAGVRFTCVAEVPGDEHLHEEVTRAPITVVRRGDAAPGSALLPALEALEPTRVDYAWVCAEGGTAAAARRHLVRERGLARRSVFSSGFWRTGGPRP